MNQSQYLFAQLSDFSVKVFMTTRLKTKKQSRLISNSYHLQLMIPTRYFFTCLNARK